MNNTGGNVDIEDVIRDAAAKYTDERLKVSLKTGD